MSPAAKGRQPERLELFQVSLRPAAAAADKVIENLNLCFEEAGLSIFRWDGEELVTIPWSAIVGIDILPAAGSAGRATALVIRAQRSTHHFAVRNADRRALSEVLSALSKRFAGRNLTAAPPARRRSTRKAKA